MLDPNITQLLKSVPMLTVSVPEQCDIELIHS